MKGYYTVMDNGIIIAVISLLGTLFGSFAGIVTSSKLTSFRLEKLEQKVDKHNSFAERIPIAEEKIKNLSKRVDNIERGLIYED